MHHLAIQLQQIPHPQTQWTAGSFSLPLAACSPPRSRGAPWLPVRENPRPVPRLLSHPSPPAIFRRFPLASLIPSTRSCLLTPCSTKLALSVSKPWRSALAAIPTTIIVLSTI